MNEIAIFQHKEKFDIESFVKENKSLIYPALFYIAGLFIGTIFYSFVNNDTFDLIIAEIAKGSTGSYFQLFFNKLGVYLSIYTACVLFGLCLIGFPFTNVIQLICGVEIALKMSFYYVNYGAKGIGYSILIIAPSAVAFITLLIFTTKTSNTLSRNIYEITTKKSDTTIEINLKSYLIKFAIYGILIVIISAISALFTYLLSSLISI